ncbi:ABC transporter ATP-binding protein [Kistimonas asteriae]|uniref:ABC transporter ATP-binding protein n=1 Tax=Kistimonas asteriae TaxID=517724 RepID=UPI001BA9AAF4|nr:dipeptide ABC transporter ATP-binding protein [Kistimonas asteriae]
MTGSTGQSVDNHKQPALARDSEQPVDNQTTVQTPHLSVRNLSVRLTGNGQTDILNNVSFDLHDGEIYALVGESGSGKSVTATAIMRLLPDALAITAGEVLLEGENLFARTEQAMTAVRGARIAMIFQDPMSALNPVHRIGDQIAETLRLHARDNEQNIRKRVVELLTETGIPDPERRTDWYPHQLSGGQQQRVMIAMALACEPDILLADEPTTALDVTIQKQILALVAELTVKRRLAVLLITHDMGVVRTTADRVGVMYQGRIIEEAVCEDFFNNPIEAYSRRLIDSLPDMSVYRPEEHETPLLTVQDLKVHFPIRKGILQRVHDHTRAVDGISLDIRHGETLALVGESGSGKSTTGRAILNMDRVTAGVIHFDGQDITNLSRRAMLPLRKRIQVIFQSPYASMNPRMTVGAIIEEGMMSLLPELNKQQRQARIEALLAQVQLEPEHRLRYPHEFSGGQRQRIAIARALAVEPDLIICDEPTSALDVSIRAEVLELLQALQNDLGVSYLFITHDLSIIPQLAHRVAVMKDGVIVEQGKTEQIITRPQHPYTQALLASSPVMAAADG